MQLSRSKEPISVLSKPVFPLRTYDLKAKFRQLVDEQHLLWQDPFVSLSRPFESGGTLEDLVHAGKISSESVSHTSRRLPHWKFTRLHAHQRNATHRLSSLNQQPQNTLIATGTGSGKTEAFLLSIVDHCLRHPQTPGVQAVIVYPMNALVNDQLRRLRELLQGTGVTFARYTGNTKYKDVSDDGDTVPEEIRTRKEDSKKTTTDFINQLYDARTLAPSQGRSPDVQVGQATVPGSGRDPYLYWHPGRRSRLPDSPFQGALRYQTRRVVLCWHQCYGHVTQTR